MYGPDVVSDAGQGQSTSHAVVEISTDVLTPNCPLPSSLPSVSSALSISQPSSVSIREGREKGGH